MNTPLLDSILANAGGANIISQEHNLGNIAIEATAIEAALVSATGWDAAEYGMSSEQAQEMLRRANTPEARARVIASLRERAIRRAGLDTSNGRVNMFAAGKAPWHRLGILVDRAATSSEAIALAGLGWNVIKVPLGFYFNGEARETQVYGLIRSDTGSHLGTVSHRYQPVQNEEGFAFMDDLLAEVGAKYETAGSLYGGKKVWMLAGLPKSSFKVSEQDEVKAYVMFGNCHDGSGAAYCFPTSERVVCANTFRVAAKDKKNGISIRHTGSVKGKLASARSAMGFATKGFEEFAEASQAMLHTPMNIGEYANGVLDQVLEITQAQAMMGSDLLGATLAATEADREAKTKWAQKQIVDRSRLLDDIITRHDNANNGIGGMRGTAWGCFNSLTESADYGNFRRFNGFDKESRKFESVISGELDEVKQVAYQMATAMAT